MDSSYQQEQLGGGRVRFTVTPAPVPKARGVALALAGAFGLLVLGTTPAHPSALMILARAAIAGCGGWWAYRATNRWFVRRADRARSPGGTFVVSASSIEASGGPSITRDQLRRLVVCNGVPKVAEPTVVNTGTVYSGTQTGAQNGRVAHRAKAAVSYMLRADHGGGSSTLAGGMTAITAHGLLTDVSRILSLA